MLQSLNSGLNSKILRGLFGVLLLTALLGLVMTDVGGFFRSGGFSRTDLAKVGSTELTVQQFDPMYRRQLQTAGIGPDQARTLGLPNMILQQEITRQTMLQAAKRVGIHVSNAYVANHLQKQLRFVPSQGSEKDKLNMILQSVGMSESEFVQAIKGDTSAQLLSNTISSQVKAVPAAMLNAVTAAGTQTRQAEIITIDQDNLPAIPAPSDDTLKSFVAEHKEAYQIPEQRNITVATIAQDQLVPAITIDDAAVKKYYDDNADQFVAPARVHFAQVIVPDEQTARTIFNEAQTTELEKVATMHKAQFVKLDWYDKPTLPSELADVLFGNDQMKRTGVLPPVKSSLGWHVVMTAGYQPESQKTLATVKKDIADLLKQEQTDQAVNKIIEDIENQAGDGTPLDTIVAPYKGNLLHAVQIDKTNGRDKVAELKLPDDIQGNVLEATFTLNDGDTSPIIEGKQGTYVLVHVDKVTDPHMPDFAAIKDKVTADWTRQQKSDQLDKLIDAVIGDYDNKKPTVKTIADKHQLPYRQTEFLSRDSKELTGEIQSVLFNLSPQNDLTSVKTKDGAVIIRLSAIKTQPSADKGVTDKQTEDLRTAVAGELQQQFVMGWRDYLGVDVNQALLEKTYLQKPAKDE
jgi:peptidyl-prolyl cis-trans isomerase D